MAAPLIRGPAVLHARPMLFEIVRGIFEAGRGVWVPRDRDALTGAERVLWLVPRLGGDIAGFTTFHDVGQGRTWCDTFWIDPAYRRRGYGRALLGRLIEIAADDGSSKVAFGTALGNPAMQGLARRCGFRPAFTTFECLLGPAGALAASAAPAVPSLDDALDLVRAFRDEARAYQSPEIDECSIMGPLLKRADALLGEPVDELAAVARAAGDLDGVKP